MTITPLPLAPTAPGTAPATPATGGDGAHFGALVLAHLSRLAGDRAPADPAGGGPAPDAGAAEPAAAGAGASSGATVLPALQAAAAAEALCSPAGQPVAPSGPVGAEAAGDTQALPADDADASVAPAGESAQTPTAASPALPYGVAQPVPAATVAPAVPAPDASVPPAQATSAPTEARPSAAASGATPGAGTAHPTSSSFVTEGRTGPSATSAEAGPAAQPDQQVTVPGAPAPGQGAAPAATGIAWQAVAPVVTGDGMTAAPAPAGDAGPLIDQVTPVVTRMVSAGEGSHRMVLRLHPADLGEVHLTVTVRGDDVDVTVAAGPEARELLAEGGGQLRSLLESIGRTTGQVVFRDLPGASPVQPGLQSFVGQESGPGPQDQSAAGTGADADHTDQADQAYRRSGGADHDPSGTRTGPRTGADHPNQTRAGAAAAATGRGALDVRI